MRKDLTISVPDSSITLEAEFFIPSNSDKDLAVLLIHPHPLYGGNLSNNVVSSLFSVLLKENKAVLRFNFRGVGQSTGSYGKDRGEQEDVKACVNHLIKNEGFKRIILIGYSYGAAIGCSVVNLFKEIVGYVAIAFPFDMFINFKDLSQSPKPKLFIQGDRDNIASFNTFSEHYEDMETPKNQKIIENCDHFYLGHENTAAKYVLDFIRSIINEK